MAKLKFKTAATGDSRIGVMLKDFGKPVVRNVLKKYGLNPDKFNLYETPKAKPRIERSSTAGDENYFKNVKNILFACNQDAVMAMVSKAEELGFKPKIYSLALEGEAKGAFLPMIKKIKSGEAMIAAGETTVKLSKPHGKGGRNMESVLGALIKRQVSGVKRQEVIVISFASDARDNTEAAGAIGDILTIQKAQKLKLNSKEFLENHDSFNFFKKTGDLIFAEKKCFNVADLMLVLSSLNE